MRLCNRSQISKHSLFICEVVKAHDPTSPQYPETVHYRGEGVFMISGLSGYFYVEPLDRCIRRHTPGLTPTDALKTRVKWL